MKENILQSDIEFFILSNVFTRLYLPEMASKLANTYLDSMEIKTVLEDTNARTLMGNPNGNNRFEFF